ncbi:MAG: dihydropteroate synthase [Lachnospiraceae bacterium]|nr:dihydropteroate synthase [Lachnospiraceae bacterium]
MKIGSRDFKTSLKTYIMGIINVTEDSFSDGGKNLNTGDMLKSVRKMTASGVDIIDVGAQSTRPGYIEVSEDLEIKRAYNSIKAIREISDIPISVDTMRASVAEASLKAGADLINDVWGARDDDMADVIAKHRVPCVLMHNRDSIYPASSDEDYIKTLCDELGAIAENAEKRGIERDKIILDPGLGFAKEYEQNLIIMANLKRLNTLGYPMLLGASRKSFIGNALDLPVNERLEGTLVTTLMAAMAGFMFVRVHDTEENSRAVRMYESIRERETAGYGLYQH